MNSQDDASLLTTVRNEVNRCLDQHTSQQIDKAARLSTDYEQLWRIIRDVSLAGGKRLRPYMFTLAYHAYDKDRDSTIVPIATAIELLHICLLIHDDIIDRDHIRHGSPNITGKYLEVYKPFIDDNEARHHYANSAALIAGDLALSSAYQLVTTADLSPDKRLLACELLSAAMFGVCGGELLDTEAAFRPIAQVDPLLIARLKTSSYSFVSPLVMGAQLADAPDADIATWQDFGTALGIAFQLTDDLLGVYGDESITGKSAIGDLREGKRTYMVIKAVESTGDALAPLIGKPSLTEDEAMTARTIIEQSGAKQATEELIERYVEEARASLRKLNLPTDLRQLFLDLITKTTRRRY